MKRSRIQVFDYGKLFRHALAKKLIMPRGGSPRNPRIIGGVPHAGGQSDIIITNHANPLKSVPWVNCKEQWIRRSLDWHFLDFRPQHEITEFCWVLDIEWEDHFRERTNAGEPPNILCNDAAHWLVAAMSLMLSRHWIGREHGINEWPPEWIDYSHGKAGVEEYLRGRDRAA